MASTTLTTLSLTLDAEKGIVRNHEIRTSPSILHKIIEVGAGKQTEGQTVDKASAEPPGVANAKTNRLDDSAGKDKKDGEKSGLKSQIDNSVVFKPPPAGFQGEQTAVEKTGNDTNGGKLEKFNDEGFQSLSQGTDESFQILPKPQQNILLLHGPRQRYSIDKARDLPELKSDQEVLIQVGGINPHEILY